MSFHLEALFISFSYVLKSIIRSASHDITHLFEDAVHNRVYFWTEFRNHHS